MNAETINLVIALFAITWLVVGLAVFILRNKPAIAELDTEAARRLRELQAARDVIAIYEKAYTDATAIQRSGVETLIAILRMVAPLTPTKTDDAALALLEDVTLPGEPPTPPAQPTVIELTEGAAQG
jgi:hypothetical protein